MIEPITPNTQAALLLTAPLIMGRSEAEPKLLSLGEYNRLARLLREKQKEPADLLGPDGPEMLELAATMFGRTRLQELLGRGFQLGQAVNYWQERSIWVVSRADDSYPRRLRVRLKEDAPPLLYGCGDPSLLDGGGLAVVGSRHVDEASAASAETVGRLAAETRHNLVSGGAKGIDRASMYGALKADGAVVGIMADSLERAALARDNREPLLDRRLVFTSPYDPSAGFNVGNAMQRNKFIYALADAALVMTSDFEKGGTWAGAIEQLEKLHLVPVFVRTGANTGKGNAALLQRGALPWPDPRDAAEFLEALSKASETVATQPRQEELLLALPDAPPRKPTR
jgi:DNA processing protein